MMNLFKAINNLLQEQVIIITAIWWGALFRVFVSPPQSMPSASEVIVISDDEQDLEEAGESDEDSCDSPGQEE